MKKTNDPEFDDWYKSRQIADAEFVLESLIEDPDLIPDIPVREIIFRRIIKTLSDDLRELTPEDRLKHLNWQSDYLKQSIARDYQAYARLTARDVDYATKQFLLIAMDTEGKEKELKKVEVSKRFILAPPSDNGIRQEEIERALQYPIAEIVGAGKGDRVRCINHEPDKHPSMSIKNNFAYCFTCGYSGDTIAVAMKLYGFNFVKTVKYLNGKTVT
jgi:hypothetical protein